MQEDVKGGKLTDGKVKPKEDTVVYSTGTGKGGHLGPAGTKHTVHRVMAEKFIESGIASLEKPAGTEEVTLTPEELKELETKLGKKPTKAQIAEAIKAKIAGDL